MLAKEHLHVSYNYVMSTILIIFVVLLVVYRRSLGKLKNKYTYILLGMSVMWWLFLVINMLRTDLVCGPDDAFCNSGNTFWGDVSWGSGIALITSSLFWIPYVTVVLIVNFRKKRINKLK